MRKIIVSEKWSVSGMHAMGTHSKSRYRPLP
jgi:hypothetical protein